MTNSIGNWLPPGSGSGVVAITRTPGIVLTFPNTSPTICSVDRVRSLHGLVTMPEKPNVGSVIWNVCRRLRHGLEHIIHLSR